MTSSSQEDRSARQADVMSVQSGEESSSGDAAASRLVNTGYKIVFEVIWSTSELTRDTLN